MLKHLKCFRLISKYKERKDLQLKKFYWNFFLCLQKQSFAKYIPQILRRSSKNNKFFDFRLNTKRKSLPITEKHKIRSHIFRIFSNTIYKAKFPNRLKIFWFWVKLPRLATMHVDFQTTFRLSENQQVVMVTNLFSR